MPDLEFAIKLGEIKHLIWQQDWKNAQALCQDILDDPRVDETIQREAREFAQNIDTKSRAEAEIRTVLQTAEQALQEPTPDYGTLLTQLERAKALGEKHNVLRWHTQILDRVQEIQRRRDLHVRFEQDRQRFHEAREAGNDERAIEIAQQLLEDAQLSQQTGLADSARQWLSQIGNKIQFDKLLKNVEVALEREDFAWAIELFNKLPPSSDARYKALEYQIADAELQLRQLNADLNRIKLLWNNKQLDQADTMLSDLPRRYRKNRTWHTLWLEFYSDIARLATSRADEYVAGGRFAEAGQFYRKATTAYQKLLDVFRDDQNLIQMLTFTNACMQTCGDLDESVRAWQRVDVASARAACKKALTYLDNTPTAIREAMAMLHQRATEFDASLSVLETALAHLKEASALYRDYGDLDQISANLEAVLARLSDLPENTQQEAMQLQQKMRARAEQVQSLINTAETHLDTPKQAANAYLEAWQLSQSRSLKQTALTFLWNQFKNAVEETEKQLWLEYVLKLEPGDSKAQNELITLQNLPELERRLLPARAELERLEKQREPSPADLSKLKQQLTTLLETSATTQALQQRVMREQERLTRLEQAVSRVKDARALAEQQKQTGDWRRAIQTLRNAAGDVQPESQARRLVERAETMQQLFDQAEKAYDNVHRRYEESLHAYNETSTTQDYAGVLYQIQQIRRQLEQLIAPLEGAIPAAWKSFSAQLSLLEHKVETVAHTWEASQNPQQSLVELVRELHGHKDQDPVVGQLLKDLTARAIAECVQQADQAEKDGYDERAQEHLRVALDLGSDDAALRRRLQALTERRARAERIEKLTSQIRVLLGQRGRLSDASKLQTELVRLLAEDTGINEWIMGIEIVLGEIPPEIEDPFRVIAQQAEDDETHGSIEALKQARAQYRGCLNSSEAALQSLREIIDNQDPRGPRIIEETQNWLRYKKRLLDYGVATSAGQLKEHVESVKAYKRLHDEVQPGEYDHTTEFEEARDAMFADVFRSADKRRSQAEELLNQGQYTFAIEQLETIEREFYSPVESAFPEFQPRLSEKFTPLGDLRQAAEALLQKSRRLQALAQRLEAKEKEAADLLHMVMPPTTLSGEEKVSRLNTALFTLQAAYREDPDEECTIVLKRLARLETQIQEALTDEVRSQAHRAIRSAENDLRQARTEDDYQQVQARLDTVDPEILEAAYKGRYEKVYADMELRRGLPARLQQADQHLEQGHYQAAYLAYKSALDVDPALGRDWDFSAKLRQAEQNAESQTRVTSLIDEATSKMLVEPETALQLLGEALSKAEAQGMHKEKDNAQRLIERTRARAELQRANAALRNQDPDEAERRANLACTFAEKAADEQGKIEAKHILDEIEQKRGSYEAQQQARTQARGLLRERRWQEAIDLLETELRLSHDDLMLADAEQGKRKADQTERAIRDLIAGGSFVEANNQLSQARDDILSKSVAESLASEIQTMEQHSQTQERQLANIVEQLSGMGIVGPREVSSAAQQVRAVSKQHDVTKGVRERAGQLAQELDTLHEQLKNVSSAIEQAQDLLNAREANAALDKIRNLKDKFVLHYQERSYEVAYSGSERIQQIRRDAISHQLATMQQRLESAQDSLVRVLLTLRETWDTFRPHLATPEHIERFDILRAQLTEIINAKQNEELCLGWAEKLQDAERLFVAKQIDNALQIAQGVEAEANAHYQDPATPLQNLPDIREIWTTANRLVREIAQKKTREVADIVEQALQDVQQVAQQGDVYQILEKEAQLKALLEDTRLTEAHRSQIQSNLERLAEARNALDKAAKDMLEIERLVNLRDYDRAMEILSAPCPAPFQLSRWEELVKVVGGLRDAHALLKQDIGGYSERGARLRDYHSALKSCIDIQDHWPVALPEAEAWLRALRVAYTQLGAQLRQALCDITLQEAISALNGENPDEADRLVQAARDQHWITQEQENEFDDLDHETQVTRTFLALESALTASSDVSAESARLQELLRKSRLVSPQRRRRALGVLRLVEIRDLLNKGNTELAQEYINDPSLINLQPFEIINREVAVAVKYRAQVRGLADQLDKIIYASHSDNFSDITSWLPEARRIAATEPTEHAPIKEKLEKVRQRIEQEAQTARQQNDYPRLRMLNPLAREFHLGEPTLAKLHTEQKRRLQEEVQATRQALETDDPEGAAEHLSLVERLGEQEQDRIVLEELRAQLKEARQVCYAADKHIEEAELSVARGEIETAVAAYQQAEKKARQRRTVVRFAETQHQHLWRTFERASEQQAYFQALEVAEQALAFGFQAREWEKAKRDLIRERDAKILTLVERLVGPGYTPDAPLTAGLLAKPDQDLEQVRDELKQALAWRTDDAILIHLLQTVEKRLRSVAEIRLEIQQGWAALEATDFTVAQQWFANAAKRLPGDHPEVTRWVRFADVAQQVSHDLDIIEKNPPAIDLRPLPGDVYRVVVHERWGHIGQGITMAVSLFSEPAQTWLLGHEGLARQQKHQSKVAEWRRLFQSLNESVAKMQQLYDQSQYQEAKTCYEQAEETIRTLRNSVRTHTAAEDATGSTTTEQATEISLSSAPIDEDEQMIDLLAEDLVEDEPYYDSENDDEEVITSETVEDGNDASLTMDSGIATQESEIEDVEYIEERDLSGDITELLGPAATEPISQDFPQHPTPETQAGASTPDEESPLPGYNERDEIEAIPESQTTIPETMIPKVPDPQPLSEEEEDKLLF